MRACFAVWKDGKIIAVFKSKQKEKSGKFIWLSDSARRKKTYQESISYAREKAMAHAAETGGNWKICGENAKIGDTYL